MPQKKKPGPKKKAPPKKTEGNYKNRLIGAFVCAFLAVCSVFGYFNSEAIFIKFFRTLGTSLFGWGFVLLPFCLLGCAYILAFHKEQKVKLRVTCTLLLVPSLGIIAHLSLTKINYEIGPSLLIQLFKDGTNLFSGGVISGLIAVVLTKMLGVFLSLIVIAIFIVAFLMAAFRITPASLMERRKKLLEARAQEEEDEELEEDEEEDDEEDELKEIASKKHPEPKFVYIDAKDSSATPRRAIDIPVDDPSAIFSRRGASTVFNKVPGTKQAEKAFGGESSPEEPVKAKENDISQEQTAVARTIEKNMSKPDNDYVFPPVNLLTEVKKAPVNKGDSEMTTNAKRLEATMHNFGINAKISNITRGPTVTRYEVELEQGVRLNRLTNLADDIALSLGASGVRIAPIPDKISLVGIEVPNKLVSTVFIRELIESSEFKDAASKLTFAIGKDIGGKCIVGNIEKLPHMLIAGTTGSGKSVCMNSLIISLLYKSTPDEVRFIMIDPKMIELGVYNGIPHLLIPVVTDPKKAAGALQWAVAEMMKRYRLFSELGVKNIASYNASCAKDPERQKLPQIVVLIDELADLMIAAAKEVEESICRVAQMARAAGMHLIIATQRPSADVITGLMKANIPSRIAFAVASSLESRIIMDTPGAEKLVGRGDMLYFPLGAGKPLRIQGTLIGEEEVEAVVEFVKKSGTPQYSDEIIKHIEKAAEDKKGASESQAEALADDADELLPAAIEIILDSGQASVSMLQRRLKLGYSRAARLVDQMEERGIVSQFEGSKPRQLLITRAQWKEMQLLSGKAPVDNFFAPDDDDDAFISDD